MSITTPTARAAAVRDVASVRVAGSRPIAVIRRRPHLPMTEDRPTRRLARAITGAPREHRTR